MESAGNKPDNTEGTYLIVFRKLSYPLHVTLVCYNYERLEQNKRTMKYVSSGHRFYADSMGAPPHLVDKERLDVLEELQLLRQPMPTLLRQVHHVQNRSAQVSQGRDGLHLDGVPILQGVVQDPWRVYDLMVRSVTAKCTFPQPSCQHTLEVTPIPKPGYKM